ncbi:MAG: hypothetical protein ACLU38_12665 [Dysosmobacter sp.]
MRYIDLFGTHPKYGMSGKKIASVTYCPSPMTGVRRCMSWLIQCEKFVNI